MTHRWRTFGPWVAAAVIMCAACGAGRASPLPTVPVTLAPTPRPPDAPPTTLVAPPGVPAAIFESVQDEASRLAGVPVDQLELVRADPITWPNGSLGCPKPGEMYTQALASGFWIVFREGTETYDFRVGRDGSFSRCELPGIPRPNAS